MIVMDGEILRPNEWWRPSRKPPGLNALLALISGGSAPHRVLSYDLVDQVVPDNDLIASGADADC